MKKVLDIGCDRGKFMLKDSMKNPERFYIGCDISENIATNSPSGVYRMMKSYSFTKSYYIHRKCLGKQMNEFISEICIPLFKNYEKGIDKKLEHMLSIIYDDKNGRKVFETMLNEIDIFDAFYSKLFSIVNDELDGKNIEHFMKSEMSNSFKDFISQYTNRIKFVLGDGKKLPFKEEIFDYTRADHMPCYMNFDMLYLEAERVTKKDGEIFIFNLPEGLKEKYPDDLRIGV